MTSYVTVSYTVYMYYPTGCKAFSLDTYLDVPEDEPFSVADLLRADLATDMEFFRRSGDLPTEIGEIEISDVRFNRKVKKIPESNL